MAADALHELLAVTGLEHPGEENLKITGAEPYLRTRYRVGTASAAAQAAIGVALAKLWKLRTGRQQRIAVDTAAATYAVRGDRHFSVDGKGVRADRSPWHTFVPVRDERWVRFHMNYPHHRAIALQVLGNPPDIEAAKKVTATWDGVALEDAIHDAGGVAAFVRSPEEWARHPQALAADPLPLIEIVRIGDAPPEPLPGGDRPLAGLRVVELTRVLAGPVCARTLAEHGADVLKVDGAHLPLPGHHELDTGLGKLSSFIDLRSRDGIETLRGLVRDGDVFSQGYRPGSLAARGFSPEELARVRPGIVYVELSAWGREGPWKHRRGFDTLVSSVRGWAVTQGDAQHPASMPCSAIDYVTGYLMALGVLAALGRRATEGGSWLVRASLTRTGRYIEDLGLIGAAELARVPAEPPADAIDKISDEMDSAAGRLRFLKPVLQLSETAPFWARPPVPVGTNEPAWPPRAIAQVK